MKAYSSVSCGCWLLVLVFNFLVGGWAVNALIQFFTGTFIPFFWAGVIGLIAGEIAVPAAIVVTILAAFRVIHPSA